MSVLDEHRDAPEFATSLRGYDRMQVDEYVDALHQWLDEATDRARTAETSAAAMADDLDQLQREQEEARAEVARLEGKLAAEPPRSMAELSSRLATVLDGAAEAADAVREAAARDAAAVREEADAKLAEAERIASGVRAEAADIRRLNERDAATLAGQLVDDARAQAGTLLEVAEQEAARARDGAARHCAELRAAAKAEREEAANECSRLRIEHDRFRGELERLRAAIGGALAGPPAADGPPADASQESPRSNLDITDTQAGADRAAPADVTEIGGHTSDLGIGGDRGVQRTRGRQGMDDTVVIEGVRFVDLTQAGELAARAAAPS